MLESLLLPEINYSFPNSKIRIHESFKLSFNWFRKFHILMNGLRFSVAVNFFTLREHYKIKLKSCEKFWKIIGYSHSELNCKFLTTIKSYSTQLSSAVDYFSKNRKPWVILFISKFQRSFVIIIDMASFLFQLPMVVECSGKFKTSPR